MSGHHSTDALAPVRALVTSFLPTYPVMYSYKNYGSAPPWANSSQTSRTVGDLNGIAMYDDIHWCVELFFAYLKPFNYSESNVSKTPRVRIHDWWLRVDRSSSTKFKEKSWYAAVGGYLKKNLSRNGENSSLFAQNRLLCHWCTSKLCPCAFYFNDRFDIKKRNISGISITRLLF